MSAIISAKVLVAVRVVNNDQRLFVPAPVFDFAQIVGQFLGWGKVAITVKIIDKAPAFLVGHPMGAGSFLVVQVDDGALSPAGVMG